MPETGAVRLGTEAAAAGTSSPEAAESEGLATEGSLGTLRAVTRRVLRLAQPGPARFAPGLIAGLLGALSAVALLATSAWLITRAAEEPPILFLSMAVVGVRAFALARASFRYLERLLSHDAAFRQLAGLRMAVFERLVPLAPDGLARTRRGDLLARLVHDVDELQNLSLRVVQPLLIAGLVVSFSVVGVWVIVPAAGATLAICLAVAFVCGTVVNAAISARSARLLAPLRGAFADEVLDLVTSIDVLTAFDAVDDRLERLATADERLRRTSIRLTGGAGLAASALSLSAGAATLLAILVGVPGLGDGSLDGPRFAVIVLVPLAVFEVCGMVPLVAGAWRQVHTSAERVATIVPERVPAGIPVDPDGGGGPLTVREGPAGTRPTPRIRLSALSARWPAFAEDAGDDGSRLALRGIDLDIAPGERVLVRGASGSGKTTLAHVLVRFLDYEGSLRFGEHEASGLSQDSVRSVVGLCEQRPWLFDADLRQNLLFARDTASDDELFAVLERVGLAEWARDRGGLDARLGERGALVSGGQTQRIALARALLAGFPVLVVDEPTANVDRAQGERLLRDIMAATRDVGDVVRTVILISHDEVPEELVTRRVLLQEGRVLSDSGRGL
ncbi:thiol reductant ABC exporter subunit CydC [Luethyella okanaganae]|uniref:Thiol reductant ABC exporter subunit CydC n=1 Tax=Luethyella okanaganae TaxID=69372 RepID=A0ABW1VFB8_9MICO